MNNFFTKPKPFPIIAAFLVALTIILVAPRTFSDADKTSHEDDEFYKFADVMAEIYWEVRNKHVSDIKPQELFEAAIQGMFMALDSYSQYLDPDSFEVLERDTEGEFSGVGIYITIKDGILTVISPIGEQRSSLTHGLTSM